MPIYVVAAFDRQFTRHILSAPRRTFKTSPIAAIVNEPESGGSLLSYFGIS